MKQIKMLLLAGILILLTACGGGGSSGNTNNNTTETLTLNQALKSYTHTIVSIQNKMYGAIGALSDNYTKVIDANTMTMDEADAFYDQLQLMEPEIIKAILLENTISSMSNDFLQKNGANIAIRNKKYIPDMGIVITGTTIVVGALISYAGYKLYSHGVESKKKLYNSVEFLIDGSKENSKLLNHIKEVLKLPKSTTKRETQLYFRLLKSSHSKESVSKELMDDANADYSLDAAEALLHHKKNIVKVAVEGGNTAFVAITAAEGAGVIGGVSAGASNIGNVLPGTEIANTTGVTIQLTAAETGAAATGAATGAVIAVVKSKEQKEEQVSKTETTMTKDQALEQLKKIKDGIAEALSFEDIASAVITVVRNTAKNIGATTKEDGHITIRIPKKFQIVEKDKETIDEGIEVQQTGESVIVIVPENTKPAMASNVDLSDDYIEISIPTVEGNAEVPNPGETTTKNWTRIDSRWWQLNNPMEAEGFSSDIAFVRYSNWIPLSGESEFDVIIEDSNYGYDFENDTWHYPVFDTISKWSVPPETLIPYDQYPMNAMIERTKTENSDLLYLENHIRIAVDQYEEDDGSCMTLGEFAKVITSKDVYVTNQAADLSKNSWEGELRAPNAGEYNNKFQIEILVRGGCFRYIYERKE